MNYKELIEHVIGNAIVYTEEYSKKEKLDEYQKGILNGLWMDVDSINNQLEIEKFNGNEKKASKLQKDLELEKIMKNLRKLFWSEKH